MDWPHVSDWPYAVGFIGAGLAIASYWMQGIIRLRLIAIFSNILALVYGIFTFSPVTIFQNRDPAAQHRAPTGNAQAGEQGENCSRGRPVDGLAAAVHEAPAVHDGRNHLPQE